ncbi:3,4-dihydroxy-2-butanone 4-phosphate synthase [Litoreibacter meonggei]|uniref:3,4-dihydroxy-2-butanone 4-phosphate synthase n=1 Tax=Litoreibacter meonggei TaxID=1049199 RepID=A0A497VJ33_9RHOB|nr:3,4-dihydroxy-2-butanone-4-phosphate synthase [Litoreibacter meonggei]RLJ40648.1 3,4-dihydroxy-2-butanone 4-phosphate synthase [Litoreibacter meonggei]
MKKFENAARSLLEGKPILLYDFDDREAETDLIYLAEKIDAKAVADLRLNAGAPLTVYISWQMGQTLGLDTYLDFVSKYADPNSIYRALSEPTPGFDPRFSITLDFRENKTGCSHVETARTVRELCDLLKEGEAKDFARLFRAPGHIPLIVGTKGLLKERNGHTELILALALNQGLFPMVVASEMIDAETGHSTTYGNARKYGEQRGLDFIGGNELMEAYG